jgi:hypothetical protein
MQLLRNKKEVNTLYRKHPPEPTILAGDPQYLDNFRKNPTLAMT